MRTKLLVGIATLSLIGCGLPKDSMDTLEEAKAGQPIRVGVIDNPPWAAVGQGSVAGLEVELLQAWAAKEGLTLQFASGPQAELVEKLHGRELDVLIGGLEKKTPDKSKLALTQAYLKSSVAANQAGKKEQRVMAVSQGESALLLSLDRHLKSHDEAYYLERLAR